MPRKATAAAVRIIRPSLLAQRSRRSGLGRGVRGGQLLRWLAVQQGLQLLAHLEIGDLLGRNVDLFPRLRVAALAGGAIAEAEAAEAPDLDFLAGLQGVHDAPKRGLHDDSGLDLRDLQLAGDDVDEIGLGHGVSGFVIHRGRSTARGGDEAEVYPADPSKSRSHWKIRPGRETC